MDDTKAMRGNSSPEDVEIFQEDLNSMYPWEKDNQMPFNGGKFMHLRMSTDSTRTLQDSTSLFTPDFQDIILEHDVVRDLGVMLDADGSFKSHRLQAQKKTMAKCSWILRTFRSRDPGLIKTLWRTLAQHHQDYASQV